MTNPTFKRTSLGGVSLLALTTMLAPIAHAQTAAPAASNTPQEIVVTAQKRTQRLQDVPLAITVVTAAQLQRQHVDTLEDINRVSPAVEFVDGAPGGGAEIRGLGTQTFSSSAEASVGIVVDGVPQGNVNQSNLFDISQIEVLRGPQGTLYGQSASAGVINISTNEPVIGSYYVHLHADVAAKGVAGSKYGQQVVQGVVNVPINDRSALRMTAFANNVTGVWHDNYTGKDSQDIDAGIHARYKYEFSSDLSATLNADMDREHERGEDTFTQTYINSSAPEFEDNTPEAAAACGIVATDKNYTTCSPLANYSVATVGGGSIDLEDKSNYLSYTSITALREDKSGPNAADISDLNGLDPEVDNGYGYSSAQQVSEELRLANPSGETLEYTAGVYLQDYIAHAGGSGTDVTLVVPYLPFPGPPPAGTYTSINQGVSSTKIQSEALFGQVDYHVAPQWHVVLGARATHEDLTDFEYLYSQQFAFTHAPAITPTYHLSDTVNNISGRFGVNYKPIDNTMVYGFVATGFKGPQLSDGNAAVAPYIVPPEQPLDFELGVKTAFLANRLSVDASLFDDDVKNYQGQSCTTVDDALVCSAQAIPHVTSKGGELDIYGRVLPNLSVNAGYIYAQVLYPSGFIGSDGTNVGGLQLAGAPVNKITFSGEYTYDLPREYTGFFDLDTVYKSLQRIYPSSNSLYDLKAHATLDARIGVRSPDDHYKVSLFVRNAFDQAQPVNIYPGINAPGYPATNASEVMTKQSQQGERVVGLSFDGTF